MIILCCVHTHISVNNNCSVWRTLNNVHVVPFVNNTLLFYDKRTGCSSECYLKVISVLAPWYLCAPQIRNAIRNQRKRLWDMETSPEVLSVSGEKPCPERNQDGPSYIRGIVLLFHGGHQYLLYSMHNIKFCQHTAAMLHNSRMDTVTEWSSCSGLPIQFLPRY